MEGLNVGKVLAVVGVLLKGNSDVPPLLGAVIAGRILQGREENWVTSLGEEMLEDDLKSSYLF